MKLGTQDVTAYLGDKLVAAQYLGATPIAGGGARPALPDTRPVFLVFGNSLAAQANTALESGTTSTVPQTPAGASSLQVSSSSTFVPGSKAAVALYTGEIWEAVVSAVPDSTTLQFTTPLPKMVRALSFVQRYTTNKPTNIRQRGGGVAAALNQIGMPVNLIQGYGWGGGLGADMMGDLAVWLARTRPAYVYLHLFENDIVAGASLEALQALARTAAQLCVNAGAKPIMATPVPSTSYSAGAMVTIVDGIRDYVMNFMPGLFPTLVPVNVSDAWVDPAFPTLRRPLPSVVTDNIHPIPEKYDYVGSVIAPQIVAALPAAPSLAALGALAINSNPLMDTTTGGSIGGAGAGGFTGAVPAGYLVNADAGVSGTLSRSGGGFFRAEIAVAGASNITTTRLRLMRSASISIPAELIGQPLRFVADTKINGLTNFSLFYAEITFNTGEIYAARQDSGSAFDATLVGKTIHFETPALAVPGATSVTLALYERPLTLGSPSGVAADVEFRLFALIPGGNPVPGLVLAA